MAWTSLLQIFPYVIYHLTGNSSQIYFNVLWIEEGAGAGANLPVALIYSASTLPMVHFKAKYFQFNNLKSKKELMCFSWRGYWGCSVTLKHN